MVGKTTYSCRRLGFCCPVVSQVEINVLEKHAVSIFRAKVIRQEVEGLYRI
jgi:hypothetical protein